MDTRDRGRHTEGAVPEGCPSLCQASRPWLSAPGDQEGGRRLKSQPKGGGGSSVLGDLLRGWGPRFGPTLLRVRKRRAVNQWGLPLSTGYLEKQNVINIPILSLKKKKSVLMHYFPEDFQCIPQCLKKSFPKNISLKHLTQWYLWCIWPWMWAGGPCPLPLWGPGLVSHQPDTQMLDRVDTHEPGPTGSSQGIESRTTVRTRITGLVPAENPPVQGRGPEVAKGAG